MTNDISDIRRENLRSLAKPYATFNDFGEAIGKSGTQVSQLIGKNPRRNMGNAMARSVEQSLSLPPGWLDREHQPHDVPGFSHEAAREGEIDIDLMASCIRSFRTTVSEAGFGQLDPSVEARCIAIMYSGAVQMGGRLLDPRPLLRAIAG